MSDNEFTPEVAAELDAAIETEGQEAPASEGDATTEALGNESSQEVTEDTDSEQEQSDSSGLTDSEE